MKTFVFCFAFHSVCSNFAQKLKERRLTNALFSVNSIKKSTNETELWTENTIMHFR